MKCIQEKCGVGVGLFDGTSLERPVLCERCGQDVKDCQCGPPDVPPHTQRLRVSLEQRKKGKWVTSVTGFSCLLPQIQNLFVDLKNRCGAGGSFDDSSLEIQGDHVERVSKRLAELKFKLIGK